MPSALPFSSSLDVVGVFDSDFFQVFQKARPVYASIRPESRIMDHPLETGSITSDYKITLPLEIEYRVVLPAPYTRDLYEEIWNLWQSSELLTVQTKARNYTKMVIASPPHEEKPDYFDALPMTIRFRQAQVVVATTNYAPADPTQTNTQNLGDQNPYGITAINKDGTISYSSVPPQQPSYALSGVSQLGGTTAVPEITTGPLGSSISPPTTTVPQQSISAGFQ